MRQPSRPARGRSDPRAARPRAGVAARALPTLGLSAALVIACADEPDPASREAREVSVWFHAGRAAERRTLEDQIARFDRANPDLSVTYTVIPEGAYNGQVQAAALAGDLPDVIEIDGPLVHRYAWQGRLRPLDGRLPGRLREELLPSILEQGAYRGRLYSIATYDSGLGLYARHSRLEAIDARVPTGPRDAWSVDEFSRILERLAANDPDGAVLDLKLNYPDEWLTYGFYATLRSAGGGLIDRSDHTRAGDVINGPPSARALRRIQSWIESGYVDPNLDDAAFTSGRVALSWVGHWEYRRYRRAFGDDLVVVPLPDFGRGTRTGQGSWSWGITRRCDDPEAAMRFLEFLLRPDEVLAMTDANGAVPATRAALERSPLYGPDGPLALFAAQLTEGYAVPRPRTPAYPVISTTFARAFRDIRNGADVQDTLDAAAATIDRDIRDNRGYPARGASATSGHGDG